MEGNQEEAAAQAEQIQTAPVPPVLQITAQLEQMQKTQILIQKKEGKQLFYSRVSALAMLVFTAAFVTALCLVLPRLLRTLDTAGKMMEQVETLSADADRKLKDVDQLLGEAGLLLEHVDSFVSSSEASLTQTMEKVDAIDLDTLNQAIRDLQAAVEPFANLMRKFG